MTFKTISMTPKGEVADAIYAFCRTKAQSASGQQYSWLTTNPQNLVRDALLFADILPKEQPGCGDRSCWKPGLPIKTSFYLENAKALDDFALMQGLTRQEVIKEAVRDYINAKAAS